MPIFEKIPREALSPAKERWTPMYFEHGRLEVDDSSVKWIGADRMVLRIPVATTSALLFGPGTTVTHAAIKACCECNTPVCWVGTDGLRFYAYGATPTHTNARARAQASIHASKTKREIVARRMFRMRFGNDVNIENHSIEKLRGMEGKRVKALYQELGIKYGVSWKGRNYDPNNWHLSDTINRAISAANAALYALVTAIVYSIGYLPQLGFIHTAGTLPFVFDIADIYKPISTLPAAFETIRIDQNADEKQTITRLKHFIETNHLMSKIPKDIEELLQFDLKKDKK